jgi:hypothetical protein
MLASVLWLRRLAGSALVLLLSGLAYLAAGLHELVPLPQRLEINRVTGEVRQVAVLGPVVHVQHRVPGTDFFARYVGPPPSRADWQPLQGEEQIVEALAQMVDRGRLFAADHSGPGLTDAAKPELIRHTLRLLRADPRAAAHYLCEVYQQSLRTALPLGMRDLPDPQLFLSRFQHSLDSIIYEGSGCVEVYT